VKGFGFESETALGSPRTPLKTIGEALIIDLLA